MKYIVVGTSFRTAPLALRERIMLTEDERQLTLARLTALPGMSEAMIVCTCNRVEVYAVADSEAFSRDRIEECLLEEKGIAPSEAASAFYAHADDAAVRHLFRVAASLDAMVVGEAQILGQVKRSFDEAVRGGSARNGALLYHWVTRACSVAKKVRAETDIAKRAVSVSSVAVDLVARVFGEMSDLEVLLVGAGETAELAARHFASRGASSLNILNRSLERAEELADRFSATPHAFEALGERLGSADVVLFSTASDECVVSREFMRRIMRERRQRRIVLIDLAVPRDVEDGARSLDNLYLFNIDDLQSILDENIEARRGEAAIAEEHVALEATAFRSWLRARSVSPLVRELRRVCNEMAEGEVQRALRRLDAGDDPRLVVERTSEAIVKKILHRPSNALKRLARDAEGGELAEAVRLLFGLQEGATAVNDSGVEEGEGDVAQFASEDEDATGAECGRNALTDNAAVHVEMAGELGAAKMPVSN